MTVGIEETYINKIRNRVKQLRENRGWTQEYLAEKVNRSREFINKFETGKQKLSFTTLVRLAIAFDMPLKDLVDII